MGAEAVQEVALAPKVANALPEPVTRRGIDEAQWRTLMNSLFPGARAESVLMVVDYCRARKLDPMKKPCHIVPMKVKDQKSGDWEWRDVVMPGIYEYRTTAMRTGNYLGHSRPEYGPALETFDVTAPEWCEMTIYRRASNGERIEFPVRVYFREACATKIEKDSKPPKPVANERWSKAPIQMLTKCTEAAGLREAFPDEFGGEPTADEVEGQYVAEAEIVRQEPPRPAQRVSQQPAESVKPADPVAPAAETRPDPPVSTPTTAHVGTIHDKGNGAALVELNTGFTAATRDAELIQAAARLRDAGRIVELGTAPSSDPSKYAPKLTAIDPLPEDAS